MSSTPTSITIGDGQLRAALIPLLGAIDETADDRWPPLATLAFVVTTSAGLWAGIILTVRQLTL